MAIHNQQKHLVSLLHCFGGTLLLVMGLSHLGFLTIFDTQHDLQNVVFPFLTNWTLYLLAALVEIAVGLAVIKKRGQDSANTLILCVVALLIWYRFAFSYAGGETCGCLGLLGRELHLGKAAERLIPKLILLLLVATTLPWMMANMKRWLVGLFTDKKTGLMVLSICLLAGRALGDLPDDKTIIINGVVTGESYDYHPSKHTSSTNQSEKVAFSILLGKSKYSISATNLVDPARWQAIVFDGTNMFTFTPYAPPIFAWSNPTNKVFVTVSKGNLYVPYVDAGLMLGKLWASFGLEPLEASDDFPLPWAYRAPWAFGWRWDIQTNPRFSSRFAESFIVRRDTNLDLTTQAAELLRPQLEYPADLSEKNEAVDSLHNRERIPNNWKDATYDCQQWFHTNDFYIPESAEFLSYSELASNVLDSKVAILVNEVKVLDHEIEYMPRLTENCAVTDYRYKVSKKKRIFEYASYTVASNQNWRSDADPELLQQAKEFLAHGREYDDYDQKKNYLLWILGAALLLPLVFMLVRQNKKQNQNEK